MVYRYTHRANFNVHLQPYQGVRGGDEDFRNRSVPDCYEVDSLVWPVPSVEHPVTHD